MIEIGLPTRALLLFLMIAGLAACGVPRSGPDLPAVIGIGAPWLDM